MSVRRNDDASQEPLVGTRALLIILVGVLAAIGVAVTPSLAVPIGVGVAVVTLLIVIVGP